MSDPPPLPSPPRLDLTTAAQVLTRSSSLFLSHLPTFVLLSLLILTFRSNLDTGATLLNAFIDSDPFFIPLFRRLPNQNPPPVPRRGRPFLHLTRVRTLDDDFFSGDHPRNPRFSASPSPRNSTPVFLSFPYSDNSNYQLFSNGIRAKEILESGFNSNYQDSDRDHGNPELVENIVDNDIEPKLEKNIVDNDHGKSGLMKDTSDNLNIVDNVHQNHQIFYHGIRFNEIMHPGFSFKLVEPAFQLVNSSEEVGEGESEAMKLEDERDEVIDLGFLVDGYKLRRRDASALFFLVNLLSAAYGYIIAGFVVTYSLVLGIVCLEVVNHYLGRNRSYLRTMWDGSALGLRRLSGLILMKWAVRDTLTQLLGLCYFGEIEDQYSFFKIFVRLKLMPFAITPSWIRGYEKETAGFMFAWLLMDLAVEFIFSLNPWVAIADYRRTGREIFKEGCHLLSTMFKPAVIIKCLESILCGPYLKWNLARYFGKLFGTAFQSLMEVYFMVTWLIFYFSVRSKEATSMGRTFGQRELEGFMQGHG